MRKTPTYDVLLALILVLVVSTQGGCNDDVHGDGDGDTDADADGDGDSDGDRYCGDGLCLSDEDAINCPQDCWAVCRDGACTHQENAETCPDDCEPACPDGLCTDDEDAESCPSDCPAECGDGFCTHDETVESCFEDCHCGNGLCDGGEDFDTCPGDCRCGMTQESAARSCRAIIESCGPVPDGRYWVNPSGLSGFEVWCDMTTHGGGWTLVGLLGESALASTDFTTDRFAATLLYGPPPAPEQYAHMDLSRFDAYGNSWTIRTATDARNDETHFQYAFFRPRSGVCCLPSRAGSNWRGTNTHELLSFLTASTTTGLTNTTWLDVPDCERGHCDEADNFLWTFRVDLLGSTMSPCLDERDQTAICHSVQGALVSGGHWEVCPMSGTATAAFGMRDGVEHCWGYRGTYWIREGPDAEGDCDGENHAPLAMDDRAFAFPGSRVMIDVLANDSDPDGDALSVDGVTVPTRGIATINGDATITYTSDTDFTGDDSFTYTIGDGHGGSDSATVRIYVDADICPMEGYYFDDYCWYLAELEQSCTDRCAEVSQSCTGGRMDSPDCEVCRHFMGIELPCIDEANGGGQHPGYSGTHNRCEWDSVGGNDCDHGSFIDYNRVCSCARIDDL